MTTLTLIQQLTWAIVEVSKVNGKPDLIRVSEVLAEALAKAMLAQEEDRRKTVALVRTAQVVGEPCDGF